MDENKIKDLEKEKKNSPSESGEKTYLTWANKIGYGSGDIAGNVVYALLSAFVMIFLTDTVGMNAGIVGTLIAVSKLFDGISDIFFGSMIDKTNTKMGGGIGTALAGWLLALSGYVGGAAVQSASTMNMLHIMYLWMPMIFNLLITLILTRLNVEHANEALRKK